MHRSVVMEPGKGNRVITDMAKWKCKRFFEILVILMYIYATNLAVEQCNPSGNYVGEVGHRDYISNLGCLL